MPVSPVGALSDVLAAKGLSGTAATSLPALGAALFLLAGIWWLAWNPEEPKPAAAEAASAAASASAAPAADAGAGAAPAAGEAR